MSEIKAMSEIEARLREQGITLPVPVPPVANYVPWRISGNLLIISGQVCMGPDGKLADRHKGKLGGSVTMEAGVEAARFCAINVLAQAKAGAGLAGPHSGLPSPRRLHCRHTGFYRSATGYERRLRPDGPRLGDAGKHARSTIGVPVLPMDCAVEVEGMFEFA